MITVLFFARYRDLLQTATLNIPADSVSTVAALMTELKQRGDAWAKVMADEHCIIAVNQQVAEHSTALTAGDEVAFYPPVTGG